MYNTINVSEQQPTNQLTMKNLRTDQIELCKMEMGIRGRGQKMATTEEKYQKIFVTNRYRVYIIYCSFPNCFIEIKFMTLFFLSYFLLFFYFHQAIQPAGSCFVGELFYLFYSTVLLFFCRENSHIRRNGDVGGDGGGVGGWLKTNRAPGEWKMIVIFLFVYDLLFFI